MIRTLIVDDEKLAHDRLQSFLRNVKDVGVVGQAKNGVEAIRMIEEERPDLVMLDVQMPGTDGFGVLQAVIHRCQVVFASGTQPRPGPGPAAEDEVVILTSGSLACSALKPDL